MITIEENECFECGSLVINGECPYCTPPIDPEFECMLENDSIGG